VLRKSGRLSSVAGLVVEYVTYLINLLETPNSFARGFKLA
jgi:hypothetical protein